MTDKELIIKWIENTPIYEKDYDTLNMLLNTTNNKFFVRVMTEIAKGNLLLSDFETVMGGPSYDRIVEDKFIALKKTEEDIKLILGANDAINKLAPTLNKEIYSNLILSPEHKEIYDEVSEEEIYDFFKHTPESSTLFRIHKSILLDKFNKGIIDGKFLNRYIDIPIIPINYNDIKLSSDDIYFALSKGITLDEVKKIKSLNYYYRSKAKPTDDGGDDNG